MIIMERNVPLSFGEGEGGEATQYPVKVLLTQGFGSVSYTIFRSS